MPRVIISCLLLLALVHCGEPPEERNEDLPTLERRLPSVTSEHGVITLGSSMESELSRAEPIHGWQFTLPARAQVTLRTTFSVANEREVDTVLVLQRADGRFLAQNDDFEGSRFSRVVRTLPAGRYRLQVHGFSPRIRGRFSVQTSCEGAGCPAPEPSCYFGGTFSDLRSHASLVIQSEAWITAPEQLASDVERQQLVSAVQQSSHTDVLTPADALAVVDQQEVRRMELHDTDGSAFVAFEYGAGDNSYGAVFALGEPAVLASIHDGDLLACTKLE